MEETKQGLNQEGIQKKNRSLLLHLLRKEGNCSRAKLARLSGLKQATVTIITAQLIAGGLICETGFLTGEKGRRCIGIAINKDTYCVLGVRLARTNYAVGLFNLAGEALKVYKRKIPEGQAPQKTFRSLLSKLQALFRNAEDKKVLAVGMAVPGPYSEARGHIELMTGVSGWEEISLRSEMEEKLHLPVFIEQDANAGALAQHWYSYGKYDDSVLLYIAAGQGVGAGIMNQRDLLKGNLGTAGEIGHTSIDCRGALCACGNRGCLENYCSSTAFVKAYNQAAKKACGFEEIAERVRQKEPLAEKLFLECCDYLAIGVVNMINTFNPGIIILGDEMSHVAPALMLTRVREQVQERTLPEIYARTAISTSIVKEDSMIHGAAVAAIEPIFQNPQRYFV